MLRLKCLIKTWCPLWSNNTGSCSKSEWCIYLPRDRHANTYRDTRRLRETCMFVHSFIQTDYSMVTCHCSLMGFNYAQFTRSLSHASTETCQRVSLAVSGVHIYTCAPVYCRRCDAHSPLCFLTLVPHSLSLRLSPSYDHCASCALYTPVHPHQHMHTPLSTHLHSHRSRAHLCQYAALACPRLCSLSNTRLLFCWEQWRLQTACRKKTRTG